jgi:hypothetical protein
LRVLVVSASPTDAEPLRVERETRAIRDELEKAPINREFVLDSRPAAPASELARYLLESRAAVVHFAGHGDKDGLAFEDESGMTQSVSSESLGRLFGSRPVAATTRLVLLNSCFSLAQAQGIARHVPVVIGMTDSIGDDVAIEFARTIYMGLAHGLSAQDAFDLAVSDVDIMGLPQADVPSLLERRPGDAERLKFVRTA